MTHEALCAVLKFEMSKNTYVQANGKVWGWGRCILMGGIFSAQSAHLHSCWGLYHARRFLRSLGSLHFTTTGLPYWVNQQGCVSLCQFRDNVPIASNYGDDSHTRLIHDRCTALGEAWNLRVLCECMADDTRCNGSCHKTHVTAMGFCMVRGPHGDGLAYPHPNAVTQAWKLQQGPRLKTPKCQHAEYVPTLLTGTLAASVSWCQTWGAQLLSSSACCQVAIRSGYNKKATARWAHGGIQRAYSMTPHASYKTAGYIHQQIQHFPRQSCCHVSTTLKRLKNHGFWKGSQYSSWILPKRLSPNGVTGAWCNDVPARCYIYRIPPRVNPPPPSPLNRALSPMHDCVCVVTRIRVACQKHVFAMRCDKYPNSRPPFSSVILIQ